MGKSNGRPETRIVLGSHCTWWGAIQDAFFDENREPHCPNCKGPMTEFRSEEDYFIAVTNFENGFGPGRKRTRKHRGYIEFTKWLKHRCFPHVLAAARAYRTTTGCEVDIIREDFSE